MPIAAPIVAALIGAGVSGTTLGLEASGALTPGSSGPSAQEQQLTADQKAQKAQEDQLKQIFKHFAPDAQANTGGALSDNSFAQLVAELSGQPGGMELAKQTIFGGTSQETQPGLAGVGG